MVAALAPAPTPTPTPRANIKTDGFNGAINNYTESITVTTNGSCATAYPAWKSRVQAFVGYANVVLNRNADNKKQFAIGEYIEYSDANGASIFQNGLDSGSRIDPGYVHHAGTVINFYCGTSRPAFLDGPCVSGCDRSRLTASGRSVEEIWLYYDTVHDSPISKAMTMAETEASGHLTDLLHEIMHASGGASEEWANYNTVLDTSGVLPLLAPYSRITQFPQDPMCGGGIGVKFSPFNEWLMNKNADGRYNLMEIVLGIPALIKVKVVDNAGNPVIGASVKTFAGVLKSNSGSTIAITTPALLLNATTGAGGEVSISSDDGSVSTYDGENFIHNFSARLPVKIIKVSAGGKNAGMYLTLTDLEMAFLQDGHDTYTITIALP